MNGKPLPKEKDKPKKKKSTSKLKKELDTIFSLYVRQKDADKNGFVRCYTCGLRKHWKELHCGHFVSRSHLATRFIEDNARPQCAGCNVFGGGRVAVFGSNLERDLGKGTIARLYRKAQEITKDFPYVQRIEEFKVKLKALDKGI